jgi:N4-gp56 family major capsid protein
MITTSTILPPPVQSHFDRALLAVPYPNLIHGLVAQYREMPAHGGNTWRGRRYNRLQTAQVPLGPSGATPPAQVATALDIDAKIQWYGTFVRLNEQVAISNQEPVLNEIVKLLGLSLRETQDILIRDMLASSASAVNCTGGGNGQTPTNIAGSDIERVTRNLITNNAWTVTDHIEGENRIGTTPIRNAFVAMCHSNLITDLESIPGWRSKSDYANTDRSLNSEWGAYKNVRFFVSSQGAIEQNAGSSGLDVYDIFVCGMEAYGVIEQTLASAKFVYRDPLYDGPLAQNASVGYKFASAQVIYQDEWIQKLRATLANS